jgi:hypothetical protein
MTPKKMEKPATTAMVMVAKATCSRINCYVVAKKSDFSHLLIVQQKMGQPSAFSGRKQNK